MHRGPGLSHEPHPLPFLPLKLQQRHWVAVDHHSLLLSKNAATEDRLHHLTDDRPFWSASEPKTLPG
jgi:hypothetical protein